MFVYQFFLNKRTVCFEKTHVRSELKEQRTFVGREKNRGLGIISSKWVIYCFSSEWFIDVCVPSLFGYRSQNHKYFLDCSLFLSVLPTERKKKKEREKSNWTKYADEVKHFLPSWLFVSLLFSLIFEKKFSDLVSLTKKDTHSLSGSLSSRLEWSLVSFLSDEVISLSCVWHQSHSFGHPNNFLCVLHKLDACPSWLKRERERRIKVWCDMRM